MKKHLLISLILFTLLGCGCKDNTLSATTEPVTTQEDISAKENVTSDDAAKENTSVNKDKASDINKETNRQEIKKAKSPMQGELSPLHVDGVSLATEDGTKIQLKGLSTHGIAWFPSYINKNLFTEFKESWNCNILRLAMYTDENGGYCNGGDKNNLLKLIDDGVNFCTELNMYVIIDWHILSDGNPNTHKSDAKDFFETVSKKYAENVNVIYEICNEPNGGTSWKDIKSYALEIIPIIRSNDPDAVIIVGTPTWSQEVDKAAADPITEYDNIMYALHFYADTHRYSLRSTMENALKKGLPLFVTEYGICDASGSGAINASEAGKWMELLNSYNISSCAWNISNKSETSSIFKDSCNKVYGFTDSDLSDSGKWLYEMLTGKTTYEAIAVTSKENTETQSENNNAQKNTASEAVSSQSGIVSAVLTPSNSWDSDGKTFTQYSITITNNNSYKVDSWTADISFDSNIEVSQGWCCRFSVDGNTLHLSNEDYNGSIEAGASIQDPGIIIAK